MRQVKEPVESLVDARQLKHFLQAYDLSHYYDDLITVSLASQANKHGKLSTWLSAVNSAPDLDVDSIDLIDKVAVNSSEPVSEAVKLNLEKQLLALSPWRKGPFELFGVHIDCEWRSDFKWQRLAGQIKLTDKKVLDVGCGNGYYMFRMLGAGAKCVLGIDPVALYALQFKVINRYIDTKKIQFLPIGLEQLPAMAEFDTVFSMGVLYHRRYPLEHLNQLKNSLKSNGELILETLVVEGDEPTRLKPKERYAGMKNISYIPSTQTLISWLDESNFKNITVLDTTQTTVNEQRQTRWMTTFSLKQFLDPDNPHLTVEGYPAPKRVIIKCQVRH